MGETFLHLMDSGVGSRERRDDVRIAALQIPEVVQVAIRKDDEPAVLGTRVPPGLLFCPPTGSCLRPWPQEPVTRVL
jgi:hypothetical protein